MLIHQRTLSKSVEVTGIGIHSGKKVTLKMNPAPADFGIQFKRVDLSSSPILKASQGQFLILTWKNVNLSVRGVS